MLPTSDIVYMRLGRRCLRDAPPTCAARCAGYARSSLLPAVAARFTAYDS
jgi:hypothetical protein